MIHVLTWPSEIGPCVVAVSGTAFEVRARADRAAERSGNALLYPPPNGRGVDRLGAELPVFPWVAVLCLVLAAVSLAASFLVMLRVNGDLQPAPVFSPVKQPLLV